jgi:hypothetical protein
VWYFSRERFATNYFHGLMLLAFYIENVDGIRILFKATVLCARHHTILYYITIQYFIFFGFFGFVPYTYTTCRGNVCYVRILDYGRRGGVGNAVE